MNVICLTTYNRFEVLQASLNSLMHTQFLPNTQLIVQDDASTDRRVRQLLQQYPWRIPTEVNINTCNLRCDANVQSVIDKGFALGGECVFVVDSDALYHPDWMQQTMDLYQRYPKAGVITTFNTDKHQVLEERDDCIVKKSMGGFAVLLKKEMYAHVKKTRGWDWEMTRVCSEMGYEMLATKNSYVDHIGYIGTHSNARTIERCATALNFVGDKAMVANYKQQVLKR